MWTLSQPRRARLSAAVRRQLRHQFDANRRCRQGAPEQRSDSRSRCRSRGPGRRVRDPADRSLRRRCTAARWSGRSRWEAAGYRRRRRACFRARTDGGAPRRVQPSPVAQIPDAGSNGRFQPRLRRFLGGVSGAPYRSDVPVSPARPCRAQLAKTAGPRQARGGRRGKKMRRLWRRSARAAVGTRPKPRGIVSAGRLSGGSHLQSQVLSDKDSQCGGHALGRTATTSTKTRIESDGHSVRKKILRTS